MEGSGHLLAPGCFTKLAHNAKFLLPWLRAPAGVNGNGNGNGNGKGYVSSSQQQQPAKVSPPRAASPPRQQEQQQQQPKHAAGAGPLPSHLPEAANGVTGAQQQQQKQAHVPVKSEHGGSPVPQEPGLLLRRQQQAHAQPQQAQHPQQEEPLLAQARAYTAAMQALHQVRPASPWAH